MKGSLHPSDAVAAPPGPPSRTRLPVPPRGTRFGRWTVCGRPWLDQRNRTMLPCRCDCGSRASVRADKLRAGRSTPCRACASVGGQERVQRLRAREIRAL